MSGTRFLTAVGVAFLAAPAAVVSANDAVVNLPGSEGLDLPNMYSGYLDLPETEKHVSRSCFFSLSL
jgi:hypothetical protein